MLNQLQRTNSFKGLCTLIVCKWVLLIANTHSNLVKLESYSSMVPLGPLPHSLQLNCCFMATPGHIIFLTLRFAIGFLQRSCPRRLNEARDCVPFSVALMPSSAQRVSHFKTNTYRRPSCSVASISMSRDCMHGCMHIFLGSLLSSPCLSSSAHHHLPSRLRFHLPCSTQLGMINPTSTLL